MGFAAMACVLAVVGGVHWWGARYAATRRAGLEAVCADHDEPGLPRRHRIATFIGECTLTLLFPALGLFGPRSQRRPAPPMAAPAPVVIAHGRWARGLAWPLARHLAHGGWPTIVIAAVDPLVTPALATLEAAATRARGTGSAPIDVVALGSAGLVARIFASTTRGSVGRLVTVGTPHHGTHAPWPFGGAALRPDGALVAQATATGQGRADVGCITFYSTDDPALLPATNAYLHGALAVEVRGLGHLATFASPRVLGLVTEALADRSAAAVPVAS